MANIDSSPTLSHSLGLLAEPAFGAAVVALAYAGDRMRAGSSDNGFVLIETEVGARGYIPEVLCAPDAPQFNGDPPAIRVVQPTSLYRSPTPGDQYGARWLVRPDEPLLVLEAAGM